MIPKVERGVASRGGDSYPLVPRGTGPPTARHYDLAARSSLYGSGGNAGEGSVGPEPKIATVERREAGVPRYGTQGASIASVRFSALHHPSSGCAKRKSKPRAQKTRRGNEEVLCDEKSFSSSFRP